MPRTNPSNVVAFPAANLPEIRSASIHSPGVLVSGSRNDVWLCPAFSGSDDLMLYVKPKLNVRQIVAELVAAQVGICMGLPCPQPYLVAVASHNVGGQRGAPARMCFGSEQVGRRSLARPVRSVPLMLEMLRKAKHAEGATVLDEWIANSVRGPGDMVFDPEGAVWLIDHEGALESGVAPDVAVTNWLASRLSEELSATERIALLEALRARTVGAHRAALGSPPPDLMRLQDGTRIYHEVVKFLHDRLAHLDYLLSHRLLPEQAHLQQPTHQVLTPHAVSGPIPV